MYLPHPISHADAVHKYPLQKQKKKADASYHMCSMTSYIYKNKLFYNVTFVILPTLPCVMTLLIV